ncbi:NADP-dependent glutamate dehydrogenase, partial [Basidiobolus ranarum]
MSIAILKSVPLCRNITSHAVRALPALRSMSTHANAACEESEPAFLGCVEQFFDKAASVSGVKPE